MPFRVSPNLLEDIDRLVLEYVAAAGSVERQTILSDNINFKETLKHGAYPPSDPRSASAAELMKIALQLRTEGGSTRLQEVLDAYSAAHGRKRAATLNARWQYLAEQ